MTIYPRVTTVLRGILVILAIGCGVTYLVAAVQRLAYPFELEWLEGAAWQQVAQLTAGQPMYGPPSLTYMPLIYPPLYFVLSAAVATLTGFGFLPLRLVSCFASLGCGVMILAIVWRETRRAWSGLVAAGLFLATYRLSEGWFDLARVDMLFVFGVLAAIYFARGTSIRSGVMTGACGALAFLTKQPALIIAVPIGLYSMIVNPRRGAIMIGTAWGVAAGVTLIMNALSGGWYTYYTFELPSKHTLAGTTATAISHLMGDLIIPLGLTVTLALAWLIAQIRSKSSRLRGWFYALMLLGVGTASLIGRLNPGGYRNVMLPTYAGLAIVAGLSVSYWSDHRPRTALTGLTLCLVQFVLLVYDPRVLVPTEADRRAGIQLVQALRNIEGEVYMPYHPYLPVLAGKPSYAHQTTLDELQGGFGGAPTVAWSQVEREIQARLAQRHFAQVIVDVAEWPVGNVAPFRPHGAVFEDARVFWLVSGWRTRPNFVYCPDPPTVDCRVPLVRP